MPKLALAAAAECLGRDDLARVHYELVARPDPAIADAPFGRARVALRAGQAAVATTALDAVPVVSSHRLTAQLATVEAELAGARRLGNGTEPRLRASAARVERLPLDPATDASVRATLFSAAVDLAPTTPAQPGGAPFLGRPFHERELREGLEQCLRTSARLTSDPDERIELVEPRERGPASDLDVT
ncbi:tetratricopeptide repeat protein [Pseudonocardia sp. ICBG601]|uniref:tetratricopeptide repeat protein n=1 Tax=Pseudonocardia sp. ICBG601 TaxID=2846759 RepID=UPI0027E3537C|nr:tetratricopeptide repeat protein [Pseudonocardia sp. ICBG601]